VSKADLAAWRDLAAVAGGACGAEVDALEGSALRASSSFPKQQAQFVVMECRFKSAGTPDKAIALESAYKDRLSPDQLLGLRNRIADLYAAQGVAAEDKKDPEAAAGAYRSAIEYNPKNAKARFNLAAIYIDQRRYGLAEVEFRALMQNDPGDYEAQYWLAEAILAQKPAPDRKAEACALLRRALAVDDLARRAEFAKALNATRCESQ
jgi:tetratricopeptide (TPR) repeat protein